MNTFSGEVTLPFSSLPPVSVERHLFKQRICFSGSKFFLLRVGPVCSRKTQRVYPIQLIFILTILHSERSKLHKSFGRSECNRVKASYSGLVYISVCHFTRNLPDNVDNKCIYTRIIPRIMFHHQKYSVKTSACFLQKCRN